MISDLPPEYVQKYFTYSENSLAVTVSKDIRQHIVFAKHDVLTDPPFSRLDLIICRNLMIYLEPEAQDKCITLFHYALKESGYLFLGSAESPGRKTAFFTSVGHKKCRLYRKTEVKAASRLSQTVPYAAERVASALSRQTPASESRFSVTDAIQEALLEEYAPIAVAINQNLDILYHNGPTNRYLRQPRGTPTQNLLELVPEDLRNRVRGALYRTSQEARPVSIRVSIPGDDERKRRVTIRISKLRENLFLLVFREKGGLREEEEAVPLETTAIEETAVQQLEHELSATREDLQSNIEQLKSLNEELQSSNEELQAANEELETSREELQSLNEELITVNAQLQTKMEEQEGLNNDLNNFLASTSIPTIFLDQRFRVKRFTPAMSRLIKLIPSDIGRPIVDMSRENLGPDLIADAEAVLANLIPVTKEIANNDSWYLRSTLPYRTSDNRIEGVVVTYMDITESKHAGEALSRSEARYRELVQNANSAIIRWKKDGTLTFFNEYAQRFFGYSADEVLGRNVTILLPEKESAGGDLTRLAHDIVKHPEDYENNVNENICRDGRRVWMAWTNKPIFDADGEVAEILAVGIDITERKQAEEHMIRLASFPELNPNPVIEVNASGEIVFCNPATPKILEDVGLYAGDCKVFLPDDLGAVLKEWDGKTESIISREVTIADRVFDEAVQLVPQFKVARIYGRDITARKKAEEELAESRRRLAVIVDSIADGFFAMNREWRIVHVNDAALRHFGKTREEVAGRLFPDVFPEARGTAFELEYGRAMETGQPVHFEAGSIVSDKTMEVHAYPGPENVTIIFRDVTERIRTQAALEDRNVRLAAEITERKKAEEKITRAKEEWERTFDSVPDLIAILDNQHRVVRVNEAMARRLGLTPRECVGLHCYEAVHGTSMPPAFCPHARTLEDGSQHIEEVHEDRLNGDFVVSTTPLYDEKGAMTGSVHVAHDITERKRAEESLKKSLQRLDLISNTANQLLMSERPQMVVESLCRKVMEHLDCHAFFNFLVDEERNCLRLNAYAGIPEEKAKEIKFLDFGVAVCGCAARDACRIVAENIPTTPDARTDLVRSFGIKAYACHPLYARGQVIGTLSFGTKSRLTFTDDELALMKLVADQVATAMERVRLLQSETTRADELESRVEERTTELSKAYEKLSLEMDERKKAEAEVRLANVYHRSLIETSLDPLVTISPHGTITDVNTATERITGYTRDVLVGTDFSDYFTEPERARNGYKMVFDQGMVRDYELEIRHADGHTTPVLYNAAVYKDEGANVIGVFAAARDISEQRNLEEHLRQSHKMEAIGTMAGGIAHDFNNVLASILGFTEMAIEDIPDRPDVTMNLERVLKSAVRARDLVKQILTFSRKTEQVRGTLSISPIIKETVQLLRASLPSTIRIDLSTRAVSDEVFASPVEIQQILMNLATNAAFAMKDEGGRLDVSLTDSEVGPDALFGPDVSPGQYVQLAIQDTGIGMAPEVMKRIFEPFFTTKEVGQGTGMGLAVVYGIVKGLHGTITVESEPGAGSAFRVFLPKVKSEEKPADTKADRIPGGSERILFIDDEDFLVELGREMLERLGYTVTALTGSADALRVFAQEPSRFDLVITDQTMPDMTGAQLARKILAIRGDIPIILCTGHSDSVSPDQAKELGIREFMMKPLAKRELAAAIRRVLDEKLI
jgi:PAS domain S-box-containing protein